MALSAPAARALEQVKMGLYMLYGAEYFTEDEWVKIDGLIHKGHYVFTRGPPTNVLEEEELMTFDEPKDEAKAIYVQVKEIQSSDPIIKDTIVVSQDHIASPSSSERADSIQSPADETPNETSAEVSSDEETAPLPTAAPTTTEAAPMFDFSETTPTVATAPAKTSPPRTNNGLPPGCTQEQLDEVRAFNASLTKAGQKSRPKYEPVEDSYSSPTWTEEFPNQITEEEQAYPSPATTERETRIHSWASEVKAQQPTPPRQIASPAPAKEVHPAIIAAEEFAKAHGRQPKSLNDFYQPNNPQFRPKRPDSTSSQTTAKTAQSIAKHTLLSQSAYVANSEGRGPAPKLEVVAGTILKAQGSFTQNSKIQIDVLPGDHIKVLKHVSGIMHVGENLRTKQRGQFPETIFKKVPGSQIPEPKKTDLAYTSVATPSVASVASSSLQNGLDRVEGYNAAEWDEFSVASRPRTTAPAPVHAALLGGLAASRFSVQADFESRSKPSTVHEITPAMKKEFGKMVDQKVDEILKARGVPTSNHAIAAPSHRSIGMKESLTPVPPKTATCWFWATPNRDCRFTAEECRDLHGYLPTSPGETANLRMGKPTWGSLADSLSSPSPTHANHESFSVPQLTTVNPSGDYKGRTKTCWYWANDGKCNYTAEDCKYLHAHTTEGIAPRPMQRFTSWGLHSWKRSLGKDDATETQGEDDDGGDLVLEEVGEDGMSIAGTGDWGVIGDGGVGGWGRETPVPDVASSWGGGDDKYKPPHVKAMEEKARMEAVGW